MSLGLFTQRIGKAIRKQQSLPPLLVLAHAGSFCKEVWRPFLIELDVIAANAGSEACVVAFDLTGHGDSVDRYQEGASLDSFIVEDVSLAVEYCRRNNGDDVFTREKPQWASFDPVRKHESTPLVKLPTWDPDRIYGIGHSVGGTAVIEAQVVNDDVEFCKLIAFEPIVVPPMKNIDKVIDNNPLSLAAEKRRQYFPSKEEAFNLLKDRPIFKSWDIRCLSEFTQHGLREITESDRPEESTSTVKLKCDRIFEARMYRTPPIIWEHLTKVSCPCHLYYGQNSNIYDIHGAQSTEFMMGIISAQVPNSKVHSIPDCGHFMIMEQPKLCAEIVARETGLISAGGPEKESEGFQPSL